MATESKMVEESNMAAVGKVSTVSLGSPPASVPKWSIVGCGAIINKDAQGIFCFLGVVGPSARAPGRACR